MAYYLDNPSSSTTSVDIPSIQIGGTAGDYLEIKCHAYAGNSGNNYRIIGNQSSGDALIEIGSSSVLVRLDNFAGGTLSTNYTQPAVGTDFVFRLEYTGTVWEGFIDGASIGSTSDGRNTNYNRLMQHQQSDRNAFKGRLYYFETGTSSTRSRFFNPSSTGGTGTSLPDDDGGTSGTLNNFSGTTDSWWVFYDDGGSISASVAQTISKPVFSIASSFVAPVTISADIAYTIAKPTFATTASKVVPTFTSDLAFNVAKPVFATAASITVPIFTSALAVDISKPVFAVSAENGQLVITSAIAASISKPVFSVAADNQVLIINSAIALSVSKPIFSVASSSIVPIFTVSTAFDVTKPIFSIASTATEPGNASASIAVLVDAPIFSVSTSLINPLLSTIDFSIDAPVFSVLNSATRPTLSAEITVDVTAPTFSVIANNGIQVYYYRSGTQVITYSQNTQIKIRTLNTNQPLYTSARHRKI